MLIDIFEDILKPDPMFPDLPVPDILDPPFGDLPVAPEWAIFNLPESWSDVTADWISDALEPVNANYWNYIWDPLDYSFYPHKTVWDSNDFHGVGNPFEDADCYNQQNSPTSCAVVAQISVYESMTGIELPEAVVCELAENAGWYDAETGTSPENVGKILEALGITVERSWDCSLGDIARALTSGDKILVGLDAAEIWDPYRDAVTGMPLEQSFSGHAVWVTGLDFESDGSVKIILNDSGTPEGKMFAVDAVDFLNAWEDTGCFMAVAKTDPISMA